MTRTAIARSLIICFVASAVACGSDPAPTTTPTAIAPPNLAGTWSPSGAFWTLQVLRLSDNFQKAFTCNGTMTLSQGPSIAGTATLSGFVVVSAPCAPISFDLTGSVQSNGAVSFTTGGPPPTEGPCPGGTNVSYTGQFASARLSARGVTNVECPEFGTHTFTYLISAFHN